MSIGMSSTVKSVRMTPASWARAIIASVAVRSRSSSTAAYSQASGPRATACWTPTSAAQMPAFLRIIAAKASHGSPPAASASSTLSAMTANFTLTSSPRSASLWGKWR